MGRRMRLEPHVTVNELERRYRAAIAAMEYVVGQVGFEADTSWHALVLQRHNATPYEPILAV